jgi:hypothetical protein
MWIKLSGSLYYFGQGGVTRAEEYSGYEAVTQKRSENKSQLFSGTTSIATVKESVDEIEELFYQRKG